MFKLLIILIATQQCVDICEGFEIQPRIINGDVSNPSDFPYFANVRGSIYSCGGALISDRWVVTAGHCLRRRIPVDVYLGIRPNGTFHRVITVDPLNQHMLLENTINSYVSDIGLIQLPEPITPNDFISPAKLPRDCIGAQINETVMAIGNGRTEFRKPAIDKTLRHGFSVVIPNSQCESALRKHPDPSSVICAHAIRRKNIYAGDSGGPLIRQKDGFLIGVTSHASIIELSNYTLVEFQIFTKISSFYQWISNITGLRLPNCG